VLENGRIMQPCGVDIMTKRRKKRGPARDSKGRFKRRK
jgi:hypothetical protein